MSIINSFVSDGTYRTTPILIKDGSGSFTNIGGIFDMSGITDIDGSIFYCANQYKGITGFSNVNDLRKISGYMACQSAFEGVTSISGPIEFINLETITGTQAAYRMYSGCTNITSVSFPKLKTATNSSINSMFSGCTSLTTVSMPLYTSNSSINSMFSGCTSLTTVSMPLFTSLPKNSGHAFKGCINLSNIDISNLTTIYDTSAASSMFYNCSSLTSIDLHNLISIIVPEDPYALGRGGICDNMFYGCTNLTSVDLSSLTTVIGPAKPRIGTATGGFKAMFSGCKSLTSLDLSSITTMQGDSLCTNMFNGCISLATVTIGGTTAIDFGTYKNQFNNMFSGCSQNITLNIATTEEVLSTFTGYPTFGCTGTLTINYTTTGE